MALSVLASNSKFSLESVFKENSTFLPPFKSKERNSSSVHTLLYWKNDLWEEQEEAQKTEAKTQILSMEQTILRQCIGFTEKKENVILVKEVGQVKVQTLNGRVFKVLSQTILLFRLRVLNLDV